MLQAPAHAGEARSAARRNRAWPGRSATVRRMAFHDITMPSITGDQVTFDDYRGKLALVVNVASA